MLHPQSISLPFLCPHRSVSRALGHLISAPCRIPHLNSRRLPLATSIRRSSSATSSSPQILHHLSPEPDDYSRSIFYDKCTLTVHAGSGGNGCVAFLRDTHVSDGPPNGGDGGTGGSVWIQAVKGHTSLHKLARRGVVKAGRGIGGQGDSRYGARGADVLVQVPVGTVVREVGRSDPSTDEAEREQLRLGTADNMVAFEPFQQTGSRRAAEKRERWVYYPGMKTAADSMVTLPSPSQARRPNPTMMTPKAPIELDLSEDMEQPILLAAGAVGGLGNPHFASKETPKPKFASKGELGVRITLELELKLLGDVGLVGLPNAGKSTLLRSLSNSRTRVGDWPFTTLAPSIGTVVLDTHSGRPTVLSVADDGTTPRSSFTIADIPGLVEDAHLAKGLGLGFLRHIERARILAFVVDLGAGDAVVALQKLWREVGEYEALRNREVNEETEHRLVEWRSMAAARPSPSTGDGDGVADGIIIHPEPARFLAPLKLPPISAKPWFVVGTKADREGTRENFERLRGYVRGVEAGEVPHPSGRLNGWKSRVVAIPVSAIRGEGVGGITEWVAGLLESG